jgi:hypothetical protein
VHTMSAQHGWNDPDSDETPDDTNILWAKYVTSLYYASTQITTVGFGDIHATTTVEKGFSVFSQMFGGFVFGYLLNNTSELLTNKKYAQTKFKTYRDIINDYMVTEDIPAPLRMRIMQFIEKRYSKPRMYDEAYLFGELPPSLRAELSMHKFASAIESMEMLRDASYSLRALLSARVQSYHTTSAQYLSLCYRDSAT